MASGFVACLSVPQIVSCTCVPVIMCKCTYLGVRIVFVVLLPCANLAFFERLSYSFASQRSLGLKTVLRHHIYVTQSQDENAILPFDSVRRASHQHCCVRESHLILAASASVFRYLRCWLSHMVGRGMNHEKVQYCNQGPRSTRQAHDVGECLHLRSNSASSSGTASP
jgi:hypothetical protein